MILQGDCRIVMQGMQPGAFHTCVTSPPYWGLRDYGIPPSDWPEVTYTPMAGLPPVTVPAWRGCLGLEPTPEMFVAHSVLVFREVWRLLRDDGTLWLNYGDSYAGSGKGAWMNKEAQKEVYVIDPGSPLTKIPKNPNGLKNKDLIGIPWRVAFALQADGWYLRMDNIWNKPNCMPESTRDRPTKAHEYMFLLAKSERYYYDGDAIKEPMAASSIIRLAQDIDGQAGSIRGNGGAKTNGTMKAVRAKGNSKTFRGGGKYTSGQSFDNSEMVERQSSGNAPNDSGSRNKRSVWAIDDPIEIWRWLHSQIGDTAYELFIQYMAEREGTDSIWSIATAQFAEAHFATFPKKLPETGILAGSPVGGNVLDPFGGSGTTLEVALEHGRECTIIEIGTQYIDIAERRTETVQPLLQF